MRSQKSKIKMFAVSLLTFAAVLASGPIVRVHAQFDACDFFPCGQVNDGNDITGDGVSTQIEDWIVFGLRAVFLVFILLGAYIIIKGAISYLKSQGDEGKIEEGTKAIKSVFIGVGILIIGIVGILILLVLTGGLDLLDRETNNLPDGVENLPLLN